MGSKLTIHYMHPTTGMTRCGIVGTGTLSVEMVTCKRCRNWLITWGKIK
jgi:hypothetical protein